MKKIISLLLILFVACTLHAQNNNPNAPVMTFVEEVHNFGDVKEGPEASFDFEFTNTGKTPLIIQDCKASCGCTTPDWTRSPVLPGQKGKISVKYDTKGRVGTFDKQVFIASNAKSTSKRIEITIKGNVLGTGETTATPVPVKTPTVKH